MSFDLYGHGPLNLPAVDTEFYSDGPDRRRGPPRCRDVATVCETAPRPHDHACCSDPCRHTLVDTCSTTNCCKSIPQKICAVFTPNVEAASEICIGRNWTLRPQQSDSRMNYSFFVNGLGTVILSVGRNILGTPGPCTWKLEIPELSYSDEIAIDHDGDIHCQAPPDFIIEDLNVPRYVHGVLTDCEGTLTFSSEPMAKVPFVYEWREQVEKFSRICGACTEFFSVICVRAGTVGEDEYTRTNFIWNPDGNRYEASGPNDDYIELIEEEGKCYFKLSNITPISWTNDLIEIPEGQCAETLSVEATEDDQWIKISGNPCHCYRYICGECRCVCDTLCVFGVLNNELVAPFAVAWDKDNLRWGNETFSIAPTRDENGNCKASVSGYEELSGLANGCGDNFAIQVSNTFEEQVATGMISYLTAVCKNCDSGCDQGTCLTDCDNVPKILYAEIYPAAWNEMLGCPVELCFEPITIALVQSYVTTVENPAGEYRWQGCGVISCRGCMDATRQNKVICIDIGCDGIGTLIGPCGGTFSVDIPCGEGETWDSTFGPFDCSGGDPCCDEAGFMIDLSE